MRFTSVPQPVHLIHHDSAAQAETHSGRRKAPPRPLWAMVGAVTLLLGACGTDTESEPAETTSVTDEATQPAEFSDTTVGQRMAWVAEQFNSSESLDVGEWESTLSQEFQDELPAADLVADIERSIQPAAPFEVTNFAETGQTATADFTGSIGEPFTVEITVDDDGVILGLFLRPITPDHQEASSLDEVVDRLDELESDVAFLVTRTAAGTGELEELIAEDADDLHPLASVFKLYVLGAVVLAIEAGDLEWGTELTVRDDLKSLPSGHLQNEPDGHIVSVEEAARLMIQVSDNTATDLLIDALGRAAVQDAQREMGHGSPEANVPFPTTAELFKIWVDPDQTDRWSQGDVATREAVLTDVADAPLSIDASAFTTLGARWEDGLDWFASAEDIARAHQWLHNRTSTHPELGPILTTNIGLQSTPAELGYASIQFKGGSIMGVQTASWLGQTTDGETIIVVMLARDEDHAQITDDTAELRGLSTDALRLALTETP